MAIAAGSDILASDFINSAGRDATPANDAGRVPKLETTGQLDYQFVKDQLKFGGTGVDGALNVTSGTTTVSLGSAAIVVKNYTTFNVSAGATLNFSNPHANGTLIIIKCQGAVTIAGTVDTRGMGGAGGAQDTGNNGSAASGILGTEVNHGMGGSVGGVGGSLQLTLLPFYGQSSYAVNGRHIYIIPGAGGGGGQTGNAGAIGGAGGFGGGALLIECRGALNFTGTINTSGSVGGTGGNATNDSSGAGGGGGAAGMCLILYNTLTSASGTITASGGAGGPSGSNTDGTTSGTSADHGAGAGSFSAVGGISAGANAGGNGAGGAGGRGVRGNNPANPGGTAGGSMSGLVVQNIWYS